MIEFKAECGHTVRAKDEDAGGVVRCSYCGRTAAVPENEKGDLSFLFRDVEAKQEEPRRRRRSKIFSSKPGGGFNPFPLVFRLCYAALLIVVLWVVVRKFIMPMFANPSEFTRRLGAISSSTPADSKPPSPSGDTSSGPYGLLEPRNPSGLYVMSTPPGASVFAIEESKAPVGGRVSNNPAATKFEANGRPVRLSDGTYVVEVAFAWNDPSLSDPALSHYDEYLKFRRAIETASDSARADLAARYFLPDEAAHVFVQETPDQIYIVRQYRGVSIRQGQSPGVRALFLPRIGKDSGAFSIEPLLRGYIPNRKLYAFDEKHVQNELTYYGVLGPDQPYVIQALARIGLIPYMAPDGHVRLFKISLYDGAFSTRLLSEPRT